MVGICYGYGPRPTIGDAALARKVIEAFSGDWEGFNVEDRVHLAIYNDQYVLLKRVLGVEVPAYFDNERVKTALPPVITSDEQEELLKGGFAREFVQELAGPDGRRPFQARTKWFYKNRDWGRLQVGSEKEKFIRLAAKTDPDEFSRAFLLSSICFGEGSDLGGWLVRWMKGNEEEQACTATALQAMLLTDFTIPSTATPLIRQVVRHFRGNREYQELAVNLVGHIETATEEAVNFLEGVIRGEKVWGLSELMPEAFETLTKLGKASIPAAIRLLDRWVVDPVQIGRHLLKTGIEKQHLPSLVRAMASNEETNEPYEGLEPFLSLAKAVANIEEPIDDDLIQLYQEGDSNVKLAALTLLYNVGKEKNRALPLCVDSLDSEKTSLASQASVILTGLRDGLRDSDFNLSLPLLFDALYHERRGVRLRAVQTTKIMLDNILILNNNRDLLVKHYSFSLRPLTKDQLSQIVFHMTEKLDDDDPLMRQSSAEILALLKFHSIHALPILVAMKEGDADESCRQAAAEAIEKIEKEVL